MSGLPLAVQLGIHFFYSSHIVSRGELIKDPLLLKEKEKMKRAQNHHCYYIRYQ